MPSGLCSVSFPTQPRTPGLRAVLSAVGWVLLCQPSIQLVLHRHGHGSIWSGKYLNWVSFFHSDSRFVSNEILMGTSTYYMLISIQSGPGTGSYKKRSEHSQPKSPLPRLLPRCLSLYFSALVPNPNGWLSRLFPQAPQEIKKISFLLHLTPSFVFGQVLNWLPVSQVLVQIDGEDPGSSVLVHRNCLGL